jgi:hypothetical protein
VMPAQTGPHVSLFVTGLRTIVMVHLKLRTNIFANFSNCGLLKAILNLDIF